MTMDCTLIVRSTNTEATPIGIPVFGVGSTPGTTTIIGNSSSWRRFVWRRHPPLGGTLRKTGRNRGTYRTLVQLARNHCEPVAFVDAFVASIAKTSIGRF